MANNIPTQTRTIDPYSSYNSNCINELTRMITRGENCLYGTHSIDVSIDTTSSDTCIIISEGICYKDDVIIEITEEMFVDMHDSDFYLTTDHFDEAGYYYITLSYTYIKARPAPEASILILKPSQISSFNTTLLFLKCVKVVWNGSSFEIDSIYDYDPDTPTIRRTYAQTYFGVEDELPTFNRARDEGRVVYIRDRDDVYYGGSNGWIGSDVVKDSIDTVGCPIGSLVYLTSSSEAALAIATSRSTFAVAVVLSEGLIADGSGKVRLFGRANSVPVEAGRTVTTGDRLYLSNTEAGSVTPLLPAPYTQFVGICLEFDAGTQTCSMWFMQAGGESSGGGGVDSEDSSTDVYTDLLANSIFCNLTSDFFNNDDYIDTVNTTATLDYTNKELTGTIGEVFISENLVEAGYSVLVNQCQISATVENSGNINWFVSNHGNVAAEYEPLTLDQVHQFSEIYVPVSTMSISFEIGEIVTGSVSLNTAIVCGQTTNVCLLLRNIIGTGILTVGETLLGSNSGATCVVSGSQTDRTTSSYNSLYIKAEFIGNGTIKDYGILYKDDVHTIGFSISETELGWGAFIDLDTTPSVQGYKMWETTSSGTDFDITNFDDGYDGKEITIFFTSNDVTIKHNSNIKLFGATDFIGDEYSTLTLVYYRDLDVWLEKSRNLIPV